jgi:YD repeat-containing protein
MLDQAIRSIILLLILLFISGIKPQDYRRFNEFNMQPEVWHFMESLEGEVNAKGDLNLSIPVMTIPGSNGLDFNVIFSYKSGILYHQIASWVGLGWNFDPGSITRDVQGNMIINDGSGGSIAYSVDDNSDLNSFKYLPDDYYITLPGKASFRMTRSNLQNFNSFGFNSYLHPYNGAYGFYPEQYKPFQINTLVDASYDYPGNYFSQPDIVRFEVVTDDGYRYLFALPSLAIHVSYVGGCQYQYHPNVWRLLAIAGPDFAGDVNNLLQGDDYQMANLGPAHAYNLLGNYTDWIKFEYSFDDVSIFCNQHAGASQLLQQSYLRWIITPTHYARFYTGPRTDIDLREDPKYNIQAFFKKLTRLEVYTRDGQMMKAVEMVQNNTLGQQYYYHPTQGDNNGKLTLKSIVFKSYYGQSLPGYTFEYVDFNPAWNFLPDVFYYDGYGYYNDAETPRNGIDRDTADAQAWSLKKITYPTGGSESYKYKNDVINDGNLQYTFKSQSEPQQTVWFNFDQWAGSYSCRHQGGVRVSKIIRENGMGDSLQITFSYGPGHVPSVPPQLFPWTNLDMLIAKNEFHVYKRGDLDVVYEWIKKSFNNYNYEITFYQISQEYYQTFPNYSRMNAIFYESPLNKHWIFHNDNNNLFWGIPWDWPVKKISNKNNSIELTEYKYQSSNRNLNVMIPAITFGTQFSTIQVAPVLVTEDNIRSSQSFLPLVWPYQRTIIKRTYDDTTRQLKMAMTKTHDKIKKQKTIYAHEIEAYGGNTWNPTALTGMRKENILTPRVQTIDYYTDLLLEGNQQNCPAEPGDSIKIWVHAFAAKNNIEYESKNFTVDFIQTVSWKCILDINDYGVGGWGLAQFQITENNVMLVNKNLTGTVPPDRHIEYSGNFVAYPGRSYRLLVSAESENAKTFADGEADYLSEPPIHLAITRAQINTYRKFPCWNGTGNADNDSAWKVQSIYQLSSDEPMCELTAFNNWNGAASTDPHWKKNMEILKYRYGKAILYKDGNANIVRIFYGDNSANMDTTFTANNFGRDYITAIQKNGFWSKQFDYDTRFKLVNQITDENHNSTRFLYDNFGRLSAILNPEQDTTLTYIYKYSSQWSPSGKFDKNYPNYIRSKKFYNYTDRSELYEFYNGRGNEIQQVIPDQTNHGVKDYYSASDLDLLDRETKNYKNFQRSAVVQPYFDKNYKSHSSGHTTINYLDFFTTRPQQVIHPDQTDHFYMYYFEKASDLLPMFYQPADSVTWYHNRIIDENGNKTVQHLDEFDQSILQERYLSPSQSLKTYFKYDAQGNVIEVYPPLYFNPTAGLNPNHCIIKYQYNTLGQMIRKISWDEGETRFRYDINGNLRFKQDANLDSLMSFIYYKYDGLDRLLEEGVWTDASAFENPLNYENPAWPLNTTQSWKIKNYYDVDYLNNGTNYCIGKLTKSEINTDVQIEPDIITVYRYDKMGQMVEKRISIKGLEEQSIQFLYDRQGNLIQTVYPSGAIIQQHYNKRNFLKKIRLAF